MNIDECKSGISDAPAHSDLLFFAQPPMEAWSGARAEASRALQVIAVVSSPLSVIGNMSFSRRERERRRLSADIR